MTAVMWKLFNFLVQIMSYPDVLKLIQRLKNFAVEKDDTYLLFAQQLELMTEKNCQCKMPTETTDYGHFY